MPVQEQRKSKRFDLKLPFELIRKDRQEVTRSGATRNMSSMGVLFDAGSGVEVGDSIEYIITLPTSTDGGAELRLRCLGKVIRSDNGSTAATLERYEFVRS